MRNSIEFEATGEFALFTDPIIGISGGRCTLPVPTYGALQGLCRAIYTQPSFEWHVAAVRIMNRISTEPLAFNQRFSGGIAVNCCLRNVRYRILAQFVQSTADFSAPQIYSIATRSLEKGGRRSPYLGMADCHCDITPCNFYEGEGFYDSTSHDFGLMYHSKPDGAVMFHCIMENGIIRFPKPSECVRAGEYALA